MLIFLSVLVSYGLYVHSCVAPSPGDTWLCSERGLAEISRPAVVVLAPQGQQQRWLQGARSAIYILCLVFSYTVSCWAVMVVIPAVARQLEVKVSIGAASVDFLGELCWSGLLSAAGVFRILQQQESLCWLWTP